MATPNTTTTPSFTFRGAMRLNIVVGEGAGCLLKRNGKKRRVARMGAPILGGDNSPDGTLLNSSWNVGDTTEVGKYPNGASPYGALDMAGNVWEWVSSKYKSYPYNANDGREDLTGNDPRVLRGRAWYINDYFRYFTHVPNREG